MGRIFSVESPIMSFLGRLGDLIVLNVLWAVCCLPIVTIGPATTAMNAVAHQLVLEECTSVPRSFFRFFKRDFRQALILGLLFLAVLSIAILDFFLIRSTNLADSAILLLYLPLLMLAAVAGYAFPLLAYYDNTILNTLKNALLLCIGNLPRTLVMCLLNLLPVLMALVWTGVFIYLIPFWLLIGYALICYLNHKLLRPIFDRLNQGPTTEE